MEPNCLPTPDVHDISWMNPTSTKSFMFENDLYKPTNRTGRRHFPEMDLLALTEWTFYPEGFHHGKRCLIDGERRGNSQTTREATLVDATGTTRKVSNQRDGLPMLYDGDKSYAIPEYSYNFHKIGSTLPAINFSRSSKLVSHTFIPLQPLQRKRRHSYSDKRKQSLEASERKEVVLLSKWKPAPDLTPSL